ncbi:MAG: molybdopterin cofactor-binding domain-containing protein, partial [Anaerolineaceae bacterium]|nr:molybdopterin cofactor-binding domain-containing protein [Anaerolineaceae bacterium]
MMISISINGVVSNFEVSADDTLLKVLRREGYFGAKFGGCTHGECGACAVLLDGKPVNSCCMLACQADGHVIQTIEGLGERPEKGWKKTDGLHEIQKAFVETGAIQCGYCTPAMVMAAKSLLDSNPNPTEEEVRESLSGVLCRCTGYLKPVQAILRAAAVLRGEYVPSLGTGEGLMPFEPPPVPLQPYEPYDELVGGGGAPAATQVMPKMWVTTQTSTWKKVGQPEIKVDAVKLALGKPAFTDDFEMRGMLYAKVLRSPHAHARIKRIDASKARALDGVAAVLTWQDIPRVVYSTAGQSDPIPGPLDSFSLDNQVRFVGDRVAFVAAETENIAQEALGLIEVEYESLPAILDPADAMMEGAPILHGEPEYVNFAGSDPKRNLAAHIRIDIGNVEQGFSEADKIIEHDYEVPKVQQAHIEPHITITYWDEDDRLVIRTSTQVPFHARRILAPVLGLPMKRIRVIKPRIGGGFGGKQEILIEDVAAHLTIATGRPVRYEYTREEEFIAARSRHPMRIHLKTGVKRDGTITANEMYCLSDTGAYGCHALTVTGNAGHKSMALYVGDESYRQTPNIRFYADVVYTNH